MINKNALDNLVHVCKAGRQALSNTIQKGKQVKKGIKAFCYLSLILSFAISPAISFAATDHLGNYDGRTDQDADGYGGAYSLFNTNLNSIVGNYTNNTITMGIGGGALYFEKDPFSNVGSINLISGTFEENSVINSNTITMGGAIYNNGFTIGTINGIFNSNEALQISGGSGAGMGGAIYNNGTINNIIGSFSENSAGTENQSTTVASTGAGGGAIYNASGAIIGSISANFIKNQTTDSNSLGGAIYNASFASIDYITGSFEENIGYNGGGAIYNDTDAYIGTIDANFEDNYNASSWKGYGGAIYNNGTIDKILGTFTDNKLTANYGTYTYNDVYGGAIANLNNINTIIANFTGNSAINSAVSTSHHAYGGAIYNAGTASIGSIYGDFISNSISSYGRAQGGAIYNSATIGSIESNFNYNKIESNFNYNNNLEGGAIYNTGTISDFIKGSFTGNTVIATANSTATSFGSAYGGAIFNTSANGIIGSIQASFDSNKATVEYDDLAIQGSAYGGAIYNTTSATISSILNSSFTKNSVVLGNASSRIYSTSSSYASVIGQGGAIFNASSAKIDSIKNTVFDTNSVTVGNAAISSTYGSGSARAQGGAIYNTSSIGAIENASFINNSVTSGSAARLSYSTSTVGTTAQGGAIYNASGTIASISGYFENNKVIIGTGVFNGSGTYIYSNQADAKGGAIYNSGTITNGIIANFLGNTISSTSTGSNYVSALGGAIYNSGTIGGNIEGYFDGNTVSGNTTSLSSTTDVGTSYRSGGGAIANDGGTIGTIKGTFSNNEAYGGTVTYTTSSPNTYYYYSGGGAIYNYNTGTIAGIIADFIGNYTNQRGGAIYNTGTITNGIAGNFTGNTAGTLGGAIYSTSNLKFVADNAHYEFTDNKDSSGYNAIYIVNTASTSATQRLLDFSLTGNSSYTINDNITGTTNYNGTSYYNYGYYDLKITGESKDTNSFNLNALVNNARNVTIDNASLNLSAYMHEDGTTSTGSISANNISFNNANLAIDLSTANANPFLFATGTDSTSSSVGDASGTISVTDSTLTLNRVTASSSPILIAQDNTTDTANTWWEQEDLITTSLVNASIYENTADADWDKYKFAITLEVNTDNEIFDTEFSNMALASVDGTITNNATLDYMQGLTHQDLTTAEQIYLMQGGTRITSIAGTAANARTALITSNNLVSSRFDTADTYSFAQHGKITQLASNGLILQERGSNISVWGMPMYSHEVIKDLALGDYTNNYSTDLFGLTAGVDAGFRMPYFDHAKLGVAVNLGTGDTTTYGDYNNITNDFNFYGFTGYGALQKDKVRVLVNLGLTRTSSDLAYGIDVASYTPTGVKAEVANNVLHIGTKAEYALYNKNEVEFTPYVGLDFININTADYNLQEDNALSATIFNMQVDNQTLVQFPIGAKASKTQLSRTNWVCLSQAKVGAIVSAGNLSENSYAYAPSTSTSINHVTQNFDILTAEAGLAYKAQKNNVQLGVDVTGQFSANRLNIGGALEAVYSF